MSRKILYICTATPYGETYGMGLRTRNIGKLLQQFGDVSMLAVSTKKWSTHDIAETSKNFKFLDILTPRPSKLGIIKKIAREFNPSILDTHGLRLSENDQTYIEKLVSEHDIIWVHTIKIANILRLNFEKKTVIDVDDYPSQFHLTVVNNSKSWREILTRSRRALTWKRREKRLPSRFSSIVVCKKEDLNAFDAPDKTYVVGNGFEDHTYCRAEPTELLNTPRLGLIGNFNYRLNSEAIEWFIANAWQSIKQVMPTAQLRLVGRGGERYNDSSNGIEGLGFVDDPAEELGSWSALIAPTRMGGGTSVKIAEAFSRHLPVIASSHGVRGYDIEAGKGILVSDDGQTFAEHCISLLADPARGAQLAEEAHRFFLANLTWDSMLPSVKDAIENAFASDKP